MITPPCTSLQQFDPQGLKDQLHTLARERFQGKPFGREVATEHGRE